MSTETTPYSPEAVASIKGMTRANFNIWVSKGQQAPDALLTTGTEGVSRSRPGRG